MFDENYERSVLISNYIESDDPRTKLEYSKDETFNTYPSKHVRIPVDKQAVLKNGIVDPSEADQIVETLRSKGVEVPYMVKYDEGHGFAKEENRLDLYKAMMGFFAEHLKN